MGRSQSLPCSLCFQSDCLGFFIQQNFEYLMIVFLSNMVKCGKRKSQVGSVLSVGNLEEKCADSDENSGS